MSKFSEIIHRWPYPSVNTLADDLEEKKQTVRKWEQRDNIPANRWKAMILSARKRKINLNAKELIDAASEEI